MIEFLLARAVARLPQDMQARYEAEWRADLAVLRGRRVAAFRWALGLQRASAELRGVKRRAAVSLVAFDALALGLAYNMAYLVRFSGEVMPAVYRELLVQTLPFAVLGGLVCLAFSGTYARAGSSVRLVKGVANATLALVAYAAVVAPNFGYAALNVPAGVCVLFAAMAATSLLLSRVVLRLFSAAGR